MKIILLILSLVVSFNVSAEVDTSSGNSLLTVCSEYLKMLNGEKDINTTRAYACSTYVEGYLDSMLLL
ncbi:MAG: hypothetical protein GY808_08775, partial [Gammaproteobacteria bacterium]|nr:hypothetical protein [Gammaproteobacteria bacterium]